MNIRKIIPAALAILFLSSSLLRAQDPMESITKAELRNHIFFLASDYMNGRTGPSAEYEIAAQYVATQFAAAGIEAGISAEDGSKSYMQGVPFTKTTYKGDLSWNIIKDGTESPFMIAEDFKILLGNKLSYDKLELVWAGYAIEEPGHNWDDFSGLDVEGRVIIFISGAPLKNGKPVLPAEIHKKYTGPAGVQNKAMPMLNKGAAGIIIADIDGSSGLPYDKMPTGFETEKYVYQGDEKNNKAGGTMPSAYLVKPGFIDAVMKGNKSNPLSDPGNILENYKPQLLKGVLLSSSIEILEETAITTNNVVGMVRGTDPVLKDEYIVVGAHLDHVKPVNGQVCNGADDNASGSSGVIEIAEAIAMNPGRRSVVFVTFTAEEMGLLGSRYFVSSSAFPKEQLKFNINLDMIGRSDPANEESRAHYVITSKKYINKLEAFISDINKDITNFPLIYLDDQNSPGGSDHQSFISEGIPGFFFFSGAHKDLHRPGDDPDKIDYEKAESICRLGYLITEKLANMAAVPTFEQE